MPPLPVHHRVVVRPTRACVEAGLASPGECWTLHRAVYGLRVSPKAWVLERDAKLRSLSRATADGAKYILKQCSSDSQVGQTKRMGSETVMGLMVVYVDDFLIAAPSGEIRTEMKKALLKLWDMCGEKVLMEGSPLRFLGLELEKQAGGINVHQQGFSSTILTKRGYDKANGIQAISMEPLVDEPAPDANQLRTLQSYAGELNWLATRSRPDVSYVTSVIASCLMTYPGWATRLWKKTMRYLRGTADVGLCLPAAGDEGLLEAWSDAGFGGVGARSQSGLFLSWAGAGVLWRSSRQTVTALNTAEAELTAAAMAWQVVEGFRSLLEEWGITVRGARLLLGNTVALTITEHGASWRTRYFSVRGARLREEMARGRLAIGHQPTKEMVADGLTKLAAAEVLLNLRGRHGRGLPSRRGAVAAYRDGCSLHFGGRWSSQPQ